jgi:hypothetical protein
MVESAKTFENRIKTTQFPATLTLEDLDGLSDCAAGVRASEAADFLARLADRRANKNYVDEMNEAA